MPKIGQVRSKQHRDVPKEYRLKSVTVSQTSSGKYYASVLFEYEDQVQEKKLVKVDRFFASSQICSVCGYKNRKTKDLALRQWDCPECGTHHDRDINATINIRNKGMRLVMA